MAQTEQAAAASAPADNEDVISPFEIIAKDDKGVDYDKLIDKYGCFHITQEQIDRVERLTGKKAHRFIRRGIFFCQRDFNEILNAYEQKKAFFLYTGRGPSADALHMGHCVPFIFTQWLQEAFDVPLVIQITDDEKYLYKQEIELDGPKGSYQMGKDNIRDILSFGFDPNKTFIFSNVDYIKELYPNVIKFQKHINYSQIKGIFGFKEHENIGKYAFPPVQAVPSFSNSFPHIFGKRTNVPCLIPAAIDQDPYFRMTRDIATKLKYMKPAGIYSTFFPALQGKKSKMSSSDPTSAILTSDTAQQIKMKINKYAFSGGGATLEEHKKNGANLEVDVPYQYLTFFLEDDARLAEIAQKYSSGEMMTGEVKAELIKCMQEFVKAFQERRKQVTQKDIDLFFSMRKIDAIPTKWKDAASGGAAFGYRCYSDRITSVQMSAVRAAAAMAEEHVVPLALGNLTPKDVAKQTMQMGEAALPMLVVDEKTVLRTASAISQFLANKAPESHKKRMLGQSAFTQAQVDQWICFSDSTLLGKVQAIESVVFGNEKNIEVHTRAVKELKEACKVLNSALNGKEWLVGESLTLADIFVAIYLAPAFQLALDAGFRKAMPNLAGWFEKMSALPLIVRTIGYVKPCQKAFPVPKK